MKSLSRKRVFVSGGSGVIGRQLIKKLQEERAYIFVGDLKPKPKEWGKEILYRQGDLLTITKKELLQFRPHLFFHLAASFERTEESASFWKTNFHHRIPMSPVWIGILRIQLAI